MNFRSLLAWPLGVLIYFWRMSLRIEYVNDERAYMNHCGQNFSYAIIHAHALAAVFASEPGIAAMISRSKDGELVVPALKLMGVKAYRGSTKRDGKERGGQSALAGLIQHLRGTGPGLLVVDGPKGPRNTVYRGISQLALAADAKILPTVVIASHRWIFSKAWDRSQIPLPFSRLRVCFGKAFDACEDELQNRKRVQNELWALEQRYDPSEAPKKLPPLY